MDGQVEASIQYKHLPVGAIQLSDRVAADHMPRVVGNGDDVVEDDVLGEQIKEVLPVGKSAKCILNDAKERLQRSEVVQVTDRAHPATSKT
jgi:hypothetical protein